MATSTKLDSTYTKYEIGAPRMKQPPVRKIDTFLNHVVLPDEDVARTYAEIIGFNCSKVKLIDIVFVYRKAQIQRDMDSNVAYIYEHTFGELAFNIAHWYENYQAQIHLGNIYSGEFWETYHTVVEMLEEIVPESYY